MPGFSRIFGALRRRRGLRVAVLPFSSSDAGISDALSSGRGGETPADDLVGEGAAEELITLLTHHAHFDVVGPISALALAGSSPGDAAASVGAGLVVTGHVVRSADRLSVEVRVTEEPVGTESWRAAWAERPEDLFGIIGEIADRVAKTAGGPATPEKVETLVHREPTTDLRAWELYLEGRALLRDPRTGAIREALRRFEGALELDDLFPGAIAAIADAYRWADERELAMGPDDRLSAIREASERALAFDESLPTAHLCLAYADLRAWELEGALTRLSRLVERLPGHAEAHRAMGRLQMLRGDSAGAARSLDRALELEPLSDLIANESGVPHAMRGRLDVAIERSRSVVHRNPENAMAYYHLGKYAEQAERHGEAVTYYRAAAELSGRVPFLTAFLGMALVSMGDLQEAEDIAHDLQRKAARGSPVATCLAVLLLRLGRIQEGLKYLESALASRELQLLLLDTTWLPVPEIRSHPRLGELLAALPVRGRS